MKALVEILSLHGIKIDLILLNCGRKTRKSVGIIQSTKQFQANVTPMFFTTQFVWSFISHIQCVPRSIHVWQQRNKYKPDCLYVIKPYPIFLTKRIFLLAMVKKTRMLKELDRKQLRQLLFWNYVNLVTGFGKIICCKNYLIAHNDHFLVRYTGFTVCQSFVYPLKILLP